MAHCYHYLLINLFLPLILGCDQPNILFVMLDDLGYSDYGFQGSDILTPNIDRLAASGVILENHYVMPMCAPSRAAYMTGKHAIRTQFWHGNMSPYADWGMSTRHTIIPQMLRKYGYSSHLVGKWHLGMAKWSMTPVRRGFDTFLGQYQGSGDHFTHILQDTYDLREDSVKKGVFEDKIRHDLKGKYSTFVYTNRTVDIISEQSGHTKPWFINLAYTAPHKRYQAPESDIQRLTSHITNDKFSSGTTDLYMTNRRLYATMVSLVDEGVGRIVKTLKETAQLDNTLIVITSDNGALMSPGSNYPLKGGKTSFYDGGVKSVAVVFSPLLKKTGYINKNIHHVVDWFPTFEYLARSQISDDGTVGDTETSAIGEEIDGVNMWHSLNGEQVSRNETLINLMVKHDKTFGFNVHYNDIAKSNLTNEHFILNGTVLQLEDQTTNTVDFELYNQVSQQPLVSDIVAPFLANNSLFVYRWHNWKLILGNGGKEELSSLNSYGGVKESVAANIVYVRLPNDVVKRVQLYDLEHDQGETNNVAKENADVVFYVAKKLLKYLGSISDISDKTYSDRGRVDGVWMPWIKTP